MLTGEAGHNFNDATRDRWFLSRLAVPLLFCLAADQLQPMRLKNAAISAAARSGSSRCGKCPTSGNRARSRLEKVAANRSVQENGNSGSCSAQRTPGGRWIV